MNAIDYKDMSPESLAILAALADSALDDSPRGEIGEEALARFACGWITPEESEQVIAALTTSDALRTRLLEMRKSLREAEVGSAQRAAAFAKEPKLAEVMTAAFKSSMKVLARWSEAWSVQPESSWNADDKRSLRSMLVDLGSSLREKRYQGAVAFARGAASAARVVVEPGNVFADLSVEVSGDESLEAIASFSKPFSEPKEVSLYVVEPGGAWSWIGSNVASGSTWSLKTPGYASMLGLEQGDVASHCFALSEGRWFMPRGWVALHLSEEFKSKSITSPTRLRLRKPPVVSHGDFVISFELPDSLREVFADDYLNVSITVGTTSFVLGSWKVKDLSPTQEVELRAPAMGIADCEFESYSAIRLTMRPG